MSDNELNRLLLSIAVDYGDKPSTSSSPNLYTLPAHVSADHSEDLHRVPSDLHNYRLRIDAGVEEQRRQREILEELQLKLLKCRQKAVAEQNRAGVEYLNLISSDELDQELGGDTRRAGRSRKRRPQQSRSHDQDPTSIVHSSVLRMLKDEQSR